MLLASALWLAYPVHAESRSIPDGDAVRGSLGERLDRFLEAKADGGFSGTVLVARDGVVVLKKGYGLADRENNIRNDSETRFNIASVSKTFTATAVLQLERDGRLSVDDPVAEHLGPFPGRKNAATIHHLLVHTAGLAVRGTELEYRSRAAFVRSMKDAPMESPPGEAYRYTNAGYTLLAAIVEETSGQKFEDYLSKRIFEPAGMRSTAYVWEPGDPVWRNAVGYAGETMDELRPVDSQRDDWGNRGPGSIATNVGDLYRWVSVLKDGLVLDPESRDRMFTAYVRDEGYGWHVIDSPHGQIVRRGGGLPNFESSLRWYIDEDLVIVVLMNNHLGFRVPVAEGIERIMLAR